MEGELCSEVQFNIVEEIAKEPASATEIALKTGLSLPYVLSQLQLLVARGLVSQKTKKGTKQIGKPKKYYSIASEKTQVTTITKRRAVHYIIEEEATQLMQQSLLMAHTQFTKNKQAISKYFWQEVNEFEKIQALGFLSESEKHVELLAITDEKNLQKLREKISNQVIKIGKQTTTMSCWIHTEEEFIYGLLQEDEYYIKHMKRLEPVFDDKNIFKQLKGRMEE